MTDEQIKVEAKKANGYSYFGKGGPISNAFNEGFEVGFKYHRDNDTIRKEVEELRDEYQAICKVEYNRLYVSPQGVAYLRNCEKIIERLNQILSK